MAVIMAVHIIKLVVGAEDLEDFFQYQQMTMFDYDGMPANACHTRYKPKQADEILASGGSLYRVIKNRIMCRQKIIGFEQVETPDKGTQCAIITDSQVIQTIIKPKRPFQGWRYLKPADVPKDRGIYLGGGEREEIPPEMEEELKEAGLL